MATALPAGLVAPEAPRAPEELARAAGLRSGSDLSLARVDRRRTQIWSLSIFVVVSLVVALVFLIAGDELLPQALQDSDTALYAAVVLISALAAAFLIYSIEKERNLRRVARFLIDQQERMSRLERLDEVRRDFLATVSHDLKTPLTTVIGAAKTLQRHSERMDEAQRDEFIASIERQGVRMLEMVQEVLESSRIESGMLRLKRERIALRSLCDATVADLKLSPHGKGRDIVAALRPDEPHMWGDHVAVQQIISNLLDNALKYSEADDRVLLMVDEEDAQVVFRVSDTGPGIAPDQLESLFDRFKRVDEGAKASGFGLGLYIVSSLVQAQGGTIGVDSTVGAGTTFTVTFPKRAGDHGVGAA